MKFAIFAAIFSFAFLADGGVLYRKQDVTNQEINLVMVNYTKNIADLVLSRPIESTFTYLDIKKDNIDVRVDEKDGELVIGGLTSSQSQSSSLSDSKVSVNLNYKFGPLVFLGHVRINGTINNNTFDKLALISMIAPDLSITFDMKAKYDARSVQVVDIDATVSYEPSISLSIFQMEENEELEEIEKAIEDELKKELEDLQKKIEKVKHENIANINESWKGKTLRDVIDMFAKNEF